jgi:hypothetical protein
MSAIKPIKVGNSKRIEKLWTSGKKGNIRKPTPPNSREVAAGFFNEVSLNHSSKVLGVDTNKRYS